MIEFIANDEVQEIKLNRAGIDPVNLRIKFIGKEESALLNEIEERSKSDSENENPIIDSIENVIEKIISVDEDSEFNPKSGYKLINLLEMYQKYREEDRDESGEDTLNKAFDIANERLDILIEDFDPDMVKGIPLYKLAEFVQKCLDISTGKINTKDETIAEKQRIAKKKGSRSRRR